MIVLPPLSITSSLLTSSTVSEPFAPANYNAGTTYGVGDFVTDSATLIAYKSLQASNLANTPASSPTYWQAVGYQETAWASGTTYAASTATAAVIVSYNHRLYESLQGSNTGKNPYSSPTYWEDIGPTMRYAMFDTLRNTATVGASPLTVVITPNTRIDAIAALGVLADTVRIQVTSAGVTVYDQTAQMISRGATNYYDYCFMPFRQKGAFLFQDIPPYTNGIVTATFTRASGPASCGALCMGLGVDLGVTQKNPIDDALNFSTVERDFDGTAILVPRRTVPKTSQQVWAEPSSLPAIRAARASLNAIPAVWAGLTDNDSAYFPSLLILGVYKQFSIALTHPTKAVISLELEEV